MTPDERRRAEEKFREEPENAEKSIPDWAYRAGRGRPLLMLHVLDVHDDERSERNTDVVAWGISFPGATGNVTPVSYIVNTTWWATNYGDDAEEMEEESRDD